MVATTNAWYNDYLLLKVLIYVTDITDAHFA